jgi:hypothetical protein
VINPVQDTLGRLLIASALPAGVSAPIGPLNSKAIRDLYQALAEHEGGVHYRSTAKTLSDLSARAGFESGGMSFGPEHLRPTPEILAAKDEFQAAVRAVLAEKNLSDKQRNDKLVHVALARMQPIQDAVMSSAAASNNPLYQQVSSGAKGKPDNLKSLLAGDTLYTDSEYQPVPFPVTHSFYEGLRPSEYYGGTFGARLAITQTKLGTAAGGFAAKRLKNITHRLVVSGDQEPQTDPNDPPIGFKAPLSDPDNEGAVLAQPIAGYPRNTVMTRRVIADLKRGGHTHAILRSPMVGGPADGGIYSLDAGVREKNRLAPIGDQVGLSAADALAEPMTQSIIGCIVRGTMVRMADGSENAIESIVVGDEVLGANENGNTFPSRVTAIFDNGARECVSTAFASFALDSAQEPINFDSTPEHKVLGRLPTPPQRTPVHELPAEQIPIWQSNVDAKNGSFIALTPSGWFLQLDQFEIGIHPTHDIQVDNPDHLFVLANGLIVSNSKHTGGVAGSTKSQQGFPVLDRMLSPSAEYPGATHAERDGTVGAITEAPHGGKYVSIDGHDHYVGPGFEPIVKPGDSIEAGDPLSTGHENPAKYVEFKGIGEARAKFVSMFSRAANDAGFKPHRRNLELIARGLIDSVEINQETDEHAPGDVVSYTSLAHGYRPREGHTKETPANAIGKYLERPALHYSIGTKVSPRVASTLTDAGIQQVPVHHAPPPFTPVMVRSHDALKNDHDWITRMLGSGLQSGLLKGVVRGDISDPMGTSWAANLATGEHVGLKGKTVGWAPPPAIKVT